MSFLSYLSSKFGGGRDKAPETKKAPAKKPGLVSSLARGPMSMAPKVPSVVPPPAPARPSFYEAMRNPPKPAGIPQSVKDVAKAVAPDTYANVKAGVQGTASPTASGVKAALNLPKELILQPASRLVTGLARAATATDQKALTPTSGVGKFFLGHEKLEPLGQELGDTVKTGHDLAQQFNPGGLDKNDPSSKFFSGAMTPAFALMAGGMKALDVEPGAEGGKKVLKETAEQALKKATAKTAEKAAAKAAKKATKEAFEEIGTFAPSLSKVVHPEDADVMTKFIDNIRLNGAPDPELELNASRVAEHYGMDMPKEPEKLADVFDTHLTGMAQQKKFDDSLMSKAPKPKATQAAGAAAGVETETGEDGKTRIKYDPLKGALGFGAMSVAESKGGKKLLSELAEKGKKLVKKEADLSEPLLSTLAGKADDVPMSEGRLAGGTPGPSAPGTALSETAPPRPALSSPSLPPQTSTPSSKIPDVSYDKAVKPQKADLVNLERMGLTEPQKDVARSEVAKVSRAAEAVTGEKLTWKEISQRADETSRVYDDLLSREETKDVAAAVKNLRDEITTAFQTGKITPDIKDKILKLKAYGADLGRQMSALGMTAQKTEKGSFEALLKGLQKEGGSLDQLLESAAKYDLSDPEQLAKWYRANAGSKTEQVVDMLRYNSMLSSPRTHAVNTFSNLMGSAGIAPAQKAIEGGIDFMRSAITGGERKAFAGEAPAYMKGYVSSVGDAAKNFWNTLSGKMTGDLPDVSHIPVSEPGTLARVGENILGFPARALEAQDQFFKTLTKAGEMDALAYRASKGVSVPNIEKSAAAKADYRLFKQGLKTPEQGHMLNAFDDVTQRVLGLRQSKSPTVRTIAKWSLPFVTTGTNTAKQMVEYSPIGYLTMAGAKNKEEQLAKAVLGTAAAGGVATLLGTERLTGGAPATKEEGDRWKAAGIQPYSVKVGDKWYSYQNMHPAIGLNFALITSLDDALKQGKITDKTAEKIWGTAWKTLGYWSDQSYVKSIGDLNRGLGGDAEKAASFISNYPQQLVPFRALTGWIARSMDDVERQIDPDASFLQKQLQQFQLQFPGLREHLQTRLDPDTGEPIKNQSGGFLKNTTPVRVTTETPKAQSMRNDLFAKEKYSEYSEADSDEASAQKRQALESYWRLKQAPKEQANAEMAKLYQTDRAMFDRIKALAVGVKAKADADTYALSKIDVNKGNRAQAIWDNVSKMESKEEKNAYLQELYEKKVLTKEVYAQLAEIKKKTGQ